MELVRISDFIQNIYTSINIYHSILLYNIKDEDCVKQLCDTLLYSDMPLFFLSSSHEVIDINILHFIENNYRMLVMPISIFEKILRLKKNNISNISVIFAIGNETSNYIMNNNSLENSMHLFSL